MSVESQKAALTDEVRREMAEFVAAGSEPGVFHDWLIDRGLVDDLYDAVCLYAPHPHLGLLGQDEIDWEATTQELGTHLQWWGPLADPENVRVHYRDLKIGQRYAPYPAPSADFEAIVDRHRRRREVMDPWLGGAVMAQFLDDFGHADVAHEVWMWGLRRIVPYIDMGEQQPYLQPGIFFVLREDLADGRCQNCQGAGRQIVHGPEDGNLARCNNCYVVCRVVDRDNPDTWPPVRYAVLATPFFEKLRWHIEYRVSQVEMETTRDLLGFIQDARRRAAFLPAWRNQARVTNGWDEKRRCLVMGQELRPLDMLPPPPRAANVIDVATWENSDVSIVQNLHEIHDGIVRGLGIPTHLAAPRGAGGDPRGT